MAIHFSPVKLKLFSLISPDLKVWGFFYLKRNLLYLTKSFPHGGL